MVFLSLFTILFLLEPFYQNKTGALWNSSMPTSIYLESKQTILRTDKAAVPVQHCHKSTIATFLQVSVLNDSTTTVWEKFNAVAQVYAGKGTDTGSNPIKRKTLINFFLLD